MMYVGTNVCVPSIVNRYLFISTKTLQTLTDLLVLLPLQREGIKHTVSKMLRF